MLRRIDVRLLRLPVARLVSAAAPRGCSALCLALPVLDDHGCGGGAGLLLVGGGTDEEVVAKVRHRADVHAVGDEEDEKRAGGLQRGIGVEKYGDEDDQELAEEDDVGPVVVLWLKPIVQLVVALAKFVKERIVRSQPADAQHAEHLVSLDVHPVLPGDGEEDEGDPEAVERGKKQREGPEVGVGGIRFPAHDGGVESHVGDVVLLLLAGKHFKRDLCAINVHEVEEQDERPDDRVQVAVRNNAPERLQAVLLGGARLFAAGDHVVDRNCPEDDEDGGHLDDEPLLLIGELEGTLGGYQFDVQVGDRDGVQDRFDGARPADVEG